MTVNKSKIQVIDERHVGKYLIVMMNDGSKFRSAVLSKKTANKYNRNKPTDVAILWDLAERSDTPTNSPKNK